MLEILDVRTKAQRKQFLKLPFEIYRNIPQWTPPLISDEEKLAFFDWHPFYEHACAQQWLAYRDGRPVGRIAGILDEHYKFEERPGFFGFFECFEDQEAATGLLTAVSHWFKCLSLEKPILYGPVNPSMNYSCGVLMDGFGTATAIMMPYTAYYYPKLLEGAGFSKAQDMFTYTVDGSKHDLSNARSLIDPKILSTSEMAKRLLGITTRQVTKESFATDLLAFFELYNRSMVDNWLFTPMNKAEVEEHVRQLKWIIDHDLITVAERDGEIVGVLIDLPDINPGLRKANGKLFPLGWWSILREVKKSTHVRCICTNVAPEYKSLGIGGVLIADSLQPALDAGKTSVEFSWVLESNTLAVDSLVRHGAIRTRTHRIYQREI